MAQEKKLWAWRRDDVEKAFIAVHTMAAYAYLRNFSDASRFSLLLDHTHWLASSVVNKELRRSRSEVEATDALLEKWLDLQEGAFGGFAASGQLAMTRMLKACGFSDRASWQKILELRRDAAFGQRLNGISRSKGTEASERLYDHARICLEALLGRATYKDIMVAAVSAAGFEMVSEAVMGIAFGARTATGFAGPGMTAALVVGWKGIKSFGQQVLIDRLGTAVADELRSIDSKQTH